MLQFLLIWIGAPSIVLHPLVWIILVNTPLCLYIRHALRYQPTNYRILSRYAESVYFMGYAATIGALLVFAKDIAQFKDLAEHLTDILTKGAQAVLSTVVGLVGMFTIRLEVQRLEEQEIEADPLGGSSDVTHDLATVLSEKTPKIAAALDALFEQLKSGQAEALANVAGLVTQFGTKIGDATAQIDAFKGSVAAFEEKTTHARSELAQLEPLMGKTRTALAAIEQSSGSLAGLWKDVTANALIAQEAGHSAAAALRPVAVMSSGLEKCGQQAALFAESVGKSHIEITAHIEILRKRAAEVGTLAEEVRKFMQVAGDIAPTLIAINKNLHEIVSVDEQIRALRGNLNLTNSAFEGITKSVTAIEANTGQMMLGTDRVVHELEGQVHRLKNLTKPLAELGDAMSALRPKLDPLAQDSEAIGRLSIQIGTLTTSLQEMENKSTAATASVKQIAAVAKDLANNERELFSVMNGGRDGRHR